MMDFILCEEQIASPLQGTSCPSVASGRLERGQMKQKADVGISPRLVWLIGVVTCPFYPLGAYVQKEMV